MGHLPIFFSRSGFPKQAFRARQTPQYEPTELPQMTLKYVSKWIVQSTQKRVKEEEDEGESTEDGGQRGDKGAREEGAEGREEGGARREKEGGKR